MYWYQTLQEEILLKNITTHEYVGQYYFIFLVFTQHYALLFAQSQILKPVATELLLVCTKKLTSPDVLVLHTAVSSQVMTITIKNRIHCLS